MATTLSVSSNSSESEDQYTIGEELEELEFLSVNLAKYISLQDHASDPNTKYMTIAQYVKTKSNGGATSIPQLGRTVGNTCFFISVADGIGDRSKAADLIVQSGYKDLGRCIDSNIPHHAQVIAKVAELTGATLLFYGGQSASDPTGRNPGKWWRINPQPLNSFAPPTITDDPLVIRVVTNNSHFECIIPDDEEEFVFEPDETDTNIVTRSQTDILAKYAKTVLLPISTISKVSTSVPPRTAAPVFAVTRATPSVSKGITRHIGASTRSVPSVAGSASVGAGTTRSAPSVTGSGATRSVSSVTKATESSSIKSTELTTSATKTTTGTVKSVTETAKSTTSTTRPVIRRPVVTTIKTTPVPVVKGTANPYVVDIGREDIASPPRLIVRDTSLMDTSSVIRKKPIVRRVNGNMTQIGGRRPYIW